MKKPIQGLPKGQPCTIITNLNDGSYNILRFSDDYLSSTTAA